MTRSRNDGDVFANYRYQFIFIDKIAQSCIIQCIAYVSVMLQFFFYLHDCGIYLIFQYKHAFKLRF